MRSDFKELAGRQILRFISAVALGSVMFVVTTTLVYTLFCFISWEILSLEHIPGFMFRLWFFIMLLIGVMIEYSPEGRE